MNDTADAAHTAALRMLGRRELSESQIRTRLARLGHDEGVIDAAIARLRSNGSVDDARVARALARTESRVRKRGRGRVRQRLAAAGISGDTADRAVEEAFEGLDEDALIRAVLEKRLGGRPTIADRRELGRLYRHLIGRGFESGRVMAILRALSSEEAAEA